MVYHQSRQLVAKYLAHCFKTLVLESFHQAGKQVGVFPIHSNLCYSSQDTRFPLSNVSESHGNSVFEHRTWISATEITLVMRLQGNLPIIWEIGRLEYPWGISANWGRLRLQWTPSNVVE
jgi:hypothetical protein